MPSHPEDRLKRHIKKWKEEEFGSNDEITFVKRRMQHPKERLERKPKKIAEGNSASLLQNFEFNLASYVYKPLIFNLRKANDDQIVERIIESLPKYIYKYYIKHKKRSNIFMIK